MHRFRFHVNFSILLLLVVILSCGTVVFAQHAKTDENDTILNNSKGLLSKDLRQFDSQKLIDVAKKGNVKGLANYYLMIGQKMSNEQEYKKALTYLTKAEELYKQIESNKELAKVYDLMGVAYRSIGDFQNSIASFQQAVKISIKLRNAEDVAFSINGIGSVYKYSGQYKKSLEYYQKALLIREKIGNKDKIMESLTNIGGIYYMTGNYEKALDFFYKSLKLFTNYGLKEKVVICLNNIGLIYFTLQKTDKAIEIFKESLKLNIELRNKSGIARDLNNIGNVYFEQNKDDEALNYFLKAYNINKEIGEKNLESIDVIGNIALIYKKRKQFDKALFYFNQTYKVAKELGDQEYISSHFRFIGEIQMEKKQYDLALVNLNKSLAIATMIESKSQIMQTSKDISDVYFLLKDYEKSLSYYKTFVEFKDTLFNQNSMRMIKETETKYETEKKENEILKLKEEKKIQAVKLEVEEQRARFQIFLFILLFGIAALIVVTYYRREKRKQQSAIKEAIIEQEKLRFMSVIEAEEKERKRVAHDLHDGLGQILSTSRLNMSGLKDVVSNESDNIKKMYSNSVSLIDEACKELRNISHNLMPNSLIQIGLISAITELSDKINESKQLSLIFHHNGFQQRLPESIEFSLYRIIQEVLNNIIKHAHASQVIIDMSQEENNVFITIIDNGVGMEVKQIEQSEGLGWKSIYSRVAMLNGHIQISSIPSEGTRIAIEFKLI